MRPHGECHFLVLSTSNDRVVNSHKQDLGRGRGMATRCQKGDQPCVQIGRNRVTEFLIKRQFDVMLKSLQWFMGWIVPSQNLHIVLLYLLLFIPFSNKCCMDTTTLTNDWLGSRLKTLYIMMLRRSMEKMNGKFTSRSRAVQKEGGQCCTLYPYCHAI